jgi:hypothetical protein
MSKNSMKYNGLRKRSDYEDLLDGILNPKQIVKYPNRDATNALNHPYLNQFRGEFDEMSEQDKAVKKAKVMLLAMQGLMAPTNTQGTNTNPPTNTAPQPPSSPSPSAYSVGSSFLNGISQTHNIMGGGATPGPSTLNSPRQSLFSATNAAMMDSSQLMDFINPTTNQDSRMYPAVSERDPNIASGSGHQVADAVHENIVETLTGAAAQRAAVTGGIFQEPPQLVRPQTTSFDIGTPERTPATPLFAPEESILLPQLSSAAAASASSSSFRPTTFPLVEAAQKARTPMPVYTQEETNEIRQALEIKFKTPDRLNNFFTSSESKLKEEQLKTAMMTIQSIRDPKTNSPPPFTFGDAKKLAGQIISGQSMFKDKGFKFSSRGAPTIGQNQLTVWLFREYNKEFTQLLSRPKSK